MAGRPGGSHPGRTGGERSSRAQNDREARGGSTGNAGGMSQALLDSKYPGATKKKSRQYEMSVENMFELGKMVGSLVGGPAGTAITGVGAAIDAIQGENPLAGALDPFEGRGPDVPSTGAGLADGGPKGTQMGADTGLAAQSAVQKKKKKAAEKPGFTLLQGVGGTLLGS